MARSFNTKPVELLAPAGTFEIFKKVINANCDAVYLGGKLLNMRMLRKGYNFSHDEIIESISMAHALDKKIYITVNNLISTSEIDEAKEYLTFLQEANADGVIVQDLGIVKIIHEMQLEFETHSSVMMNVHNLPMVEALQKYGVSRTVVSREMDLQAAKQLQLSTGIEIEYFVHGDMCTVHGANCLYSSILYGNSSNRGRCLKPCRWYFDLKKDGKVYPTEYPLAAKDMYMFEHIPELINANVSSFKIEGRMRDAEFVVNLVNTYGDAIDRYIADPLSYQRNKDADYLYENRKRDFSTAYAFGKPGLSFINRRYEGTGKFYSTGKVFSIPTEEPGISEKHFNTIKDELLRTSKNYLHTPKLTVRVNTLDQAKICIKHKVSRIYVPSEVFEPYVPFTVSELTQLQSEKGDTELFLALPRMMTALHFDIFDQYLSTHRDLFDGILATNLGAANRYRDFTMVGDFTLNVFNNEARDFYLNHGVNVFTHSIEKKLPDFIEFLTNNDSPTEMIVHGQPIIMYMDLDLFENLDTVAATAEEDNVFVPNQTLVLKSDAGELPVYRDQDGRNHIAMAKELYYLPLLKYLSHCNIEYFRIEGTTYTSSELETIVVAYTEAINQIETLNDFEDSLDMLQSVRAGFTFGSLSYTTEANKVSQN